MRKETLSPVDHKCDCGREKNITPTVGGIDCECGQKMPRIIPLIAQQPIPIQEIKINEKAKKLKSVQL